MTYTQSGRAVTKFSVAVSRRFKDAAGERQEETTWFNITAWERLGETCNQYLHKGSKVMIEGRMASHDYTDKDGVKRTAWDLIATDMEMLDSKADSERRGSGAGNGAATEDDGIPF